ncbi:hypothetical protein PMAC_003013 [Pneumocystis sp. 'macacae']|nr:hypothetical protein PMAC_003013 [Pneumocystis sp. 'macacae']
MNKRWKEMESRSNKIEEVEGDEEEGYIRGGEVDGVHQVSEMSECEKEIGWEEVCTRSSSRGGGRGGGGGGGG